jgi:hypothetical protein
VLAALSVATIFGCPARWAPILPLALLAFTISFFRDPEAEVPVDPRLIVAPATGKIVEIRTVNEAHFIQGEATMVAVFLSVFDVHVQRAPIGGTIQFVQYNKGKFLDARNPNASLQNENRVVGIESADGFRGDGTADFRPDRAADCRMGRARRAVGERGAVWYDTIWFTRGVVFATGHGNRRKGGGLRERW